MSKHPNPDNVSGAAPDLGFPTFMIYWALRSEAFRNMLAVTAEQAIVLYTAWQAVFQSGTEFEAGHDRANTRPEHGAFFVACQPVWESRVSQVLSAAQLRRLRQIELQERGLFACEVPEVQNALEMSNDQRARIATAVSKYREALEPESLARRARADTALEQVKSHPRLSRKDLHSIMDSVTQNTEGAAVRDARSGACQAIHDALTPEQHHALDDLLGERLDTMALLNASDEASNLAWL